MHTIYFATGNEGKFNNAKDIIASLKRIEVDLPEVQSLDPRYIIEQKLKASKKLDKRPLLVEDTSLYLDSLNGFPGPLIKWLLKSVDACGIAEICKKLDKRTAVAKTVLGYDDGQGQVQYFEGEIRGIIVTPKGCGGFGWDSIFQPEGQAQTFAEMGQAKSAVSMRTIALEKLLTYLNRSGK